MQVPAGVRGRQVRPVRRKPDLCACRRRGHPLLPLRSSPQGRTKRIFWSCPLLLHTPRAPTSPPRTSRARAQDPTPAWAPGPHCSMTTTTVTTATTFTGTTARTTCARTPATSLTLSPFSLWLSCLVLYLCLCCIVA